VGVHQVSIGRAKSSTRACMMLAAFAMTAARSAKLVCRHFSKQTEVFHCTG
jgi:hypothetical protein